MQNNTEFTQNILEISDVSSSEISYNEPPSSDGYNETPSSDGYDETPEISTPEDLPELISSYSEENINVTLPPIILKPSMSLASGIEDYKGFDIKTYKNLECLFGYTAMEDCPCQYKVFATMMRPLAVHSKFAGKNLRNMDIFVIRRKLDKDGNKIKDNYEPYPCILVDIPKTDTFKFADIVIEGERGREEVIAERVFFDMS